MTVVGFKSKREASREGKLEVLQWGLGQVEEREDVTGVAVVLVYDDGSLKCDFQGKSNQLLAGTTRMLFHLNRCLDENEE